MPHSHMRLEVDKSSYPSVILYNIVYNKHIRKTVVICYYSMTYAERVTLDIGQLIMRRYIKNTSKTTIEIAITPLISPRIITVLIRWGQYGGGSTMGSTIMYNIQIMGSTHHEAHYHRIHRDEIHSLLQLIINTFQIILFY